MGPIASGYGALVVKNWLHEVYAGGPARGVLRVVSYQRSKRKDAPPPPSRLLRYLTLTKGLPQLQHIANENALLFSLSEMT